MNENNENKSAKKGDSLYLDRLRFRPEDGKSVIGFFIKHFRVVLLLIMALFATGIFSLLSLPLESDPEVEIPVGFVTVGYPGASPADVEELIIKKVEPEVVNLAGVDEISSIAANSFANVTVEFLPSEDLDDAIRRLRDAVDNIKNDLPEDATDPVVQQVALEDIPVWNIVVTGPYDNFTLREYAETVQESLEELSGASEVRISGGDTPEIRINYDAAKLAQYNLSIDQINNAIAFTNLDIPLGTVELSDFNYTVSSEGTFTTAAELRRLPVSSFEGQIIRLQDVADVFEQARDTGVETFFSIEGGESNNAITLDVVKKVGSSIVALIDEGKAKIEELKVTELPDDVEIESTLDFSREIRNNIRDLTRSGMATVILVVIILFLFVGFKEAFVAGLAIPMVFAASFGVMAATGVTLNFLSLFSLILSLGMLVDNAIVVLQASKQYIRTGKFTPEEAVLLVFRDFKFTLITTTLTTVWAFLPLLLSTGIIGQYVRSIPITVSATLISSLLIAFFVNHPLAVVLERVRFTRNYFRIIYIGLIVLFLVSISILLQGQAVAGGVMTAIFGALLISLGLHYRRKLKEKLQRQEELVMEERANPDKIKERLKAKYLDLDDGTKKSFGNRLYTGLIRLSALLPAYERMLRFFMRKKILSFFVLVLAFVTFAGSLSLPITGILKPTFLPPNDFIFMYVNIEGPPGMIAERTREVADQVTEVLRTQDIIKNFSLVAGSTGSDVSSFSSIASGGNSNRAQFAILLHELEDRPIVEELGRGEKSYEFAPRLRELLKPIDGADVNVQEIAGGPPSGADFAATIAGEDLEELERLANKYRDIVAAIPGTVDEETSIELNPGEFSFIFDYDQLHLRGLSVVQVASTLRTALSGSEVTTVFQEGDEISVIAAVEEDSVPTIDAILNLSLSNGRGQLFKLGDVVDVELGSSLTSISRLDQKRVMSVTAAVEAPTNPTEVFDQFLNAVEKDPLPAGYEFVFGGANEQTTESVISIFRAMGVALMLIIATLVIQLNSFRKSAIVLLTIPMATTGVFYGLVAIGSELSFPVLIGVLALFGIVINNAIILVDKIGRNTEVGIPFVDAVVDAASSRLEAIFLTSVATIMGMFPIALTDEIWGGLGWSLIFGLSSSMFLTLLVIPIAYNLVLCKAGERQERMREMEEQAANV